MGEANDVKRAADASLDVDYTAATSDAMSALAAIVNNPAVSAALASLLREAKRLQERGERLTPETPEIRQLLREVDSNIGVALQSVDDAAQLLIIAATSVAGQEAQAATRTMAGSLAKDVAAEWNRTSVEVMRAAIDILDNPAWREQLDAIAPRTSEVVRNQVLSGLARGENPITVAGNVRRIVTQLPAHYADTMMRTVQLTSYREATAQNYARNQHIIAGQIRIATLDDRTCLACIALHGTKLPADEVVRDHYNGRCVGVPNVRGVTFDIPSGEEWLRRQSTDRQRRIMGPSKYNAWQADAVTLDEFVQVVDDDVLGFFPVESSLKRLVGVQNATNFRRA